MILGKSICNKAYMHYTKV